MNESRSTGTEHPEFPTVVAHGRSVWTTVQTDGGFLSITGLSFFDPWLASQAAEAGEDLPGWVHQTLVRGAAARLESRVDLLLEGVVAESRRLRQTLAVMTRSKSANRRLALHASRSEDELLDRLLRLEAVVETIQEVRTK